MADSIGNVFVVDNGNNLIRKIDTSGNVTTFAGSGTKSSVDGQSLEASFNSPTHITVDSAGNLYVSEYGSS